jgi:hypothetical protein
MTSIQLLKMSSRCRPAVKGRARASLGQRALIWLSLAMASWGGLIGLAWVGARLLQALSGQA